MEQRHAARAGAARAAEAGPDPTEPRRPIEDAYLPQDAQSALTALVDAGLAPVWVRDFRHHTREDGSTFYVDPRTGETYDAIPALHSSDGKDV